MIDTQAIRSKILDLAIQGLLTDRFTEDGTGEELLAKIIAGKQGKLRGGKQHLPISTTPPFGMPVGWAWAQLETLGANIPNAFADGPFGSNLKKEHYTTERQVRIIQLSNVGVDGWRNNNEKYTTYEHLENVKRSEVKAGNIVIAKMMPAGRAIVVPEGIADSFVLSSDCIKFVPDPLLDVNYLCFAINSNWFHEQVINDVHGIGRERTSLSNLKRYFLPIPSAPEQHRIVAIIQKAFSSLDTIDALQAKYADNLTVLKSKLIDAAIQGKLTEQLPEDGTAEELYQQIQAEKQALIKTGKIKKEKPLPEINAKEIPFAIPSNWKWVRLASICYSIFAGGDKPQDFVKIKNIEHTIPVVANGVSNDGIMGYTATATAPANTITVAGRGTIGFPCYRSYDYYPIVRLIVIMQCALLEPRYLYYVFRGLPADSVGSSIPQLTVPMVNPKLIPLPPLAEQLRIVERLGKLLTVCDELKNG